MPFVILEKQVPNQWTQLEKGDNVTYSLEGKEYSLFSGGLQLEHHTPEATRLGGVTTRLIDISRLFSSSTGR